MLAPRARLDALIRKLRGCSGRGEAEEAPVAILLSRV